MKKNIYLFRIFVLFTVFISCSFGIVYGVTSKDFNNYKFNPFVFPYPEYFYTAETITVNKQQKCPDNTQKINFFGFSANIPEEFAKNANLKSPTTFIVKSDKKHGLLIVKEKEQLMGCISKEEKEKNKDFCSVFNSTKDFYQKLFTMTPEDLDKVEFSGKGYSWLVHRKGWMFNRTSKISIYKSENFTAYRSDISDKAMSIKTDFVIFPNKIHPDHITVSMNFIDENFVNSFLSSLE